MRGHADLDGARRPTPRNGWAGITPDDVALARRGNRTRDRRRSPRTRRARRPRSDRRDDRPDPGRDVRAQAHSRRPLDLLARSGATGLRAGEIERPAKPACAPDRAGKPTVPRSRCAPCAIVTLWRRPILWRCRTGSGRRGRIKAIQDGLLTFHSVEPAGTAKTGSRRYRLDEGRTLCSSRFGDWKGRRSRAGGQAVPQDQDGQRRADRAIDDRKARNR